MEVGDKIGSDMVAADERGCTRLRHDKSRTLIPPIGDRSSGRGMSPAEPEQRGAT